MNGVEIIGIAREATVHDSINIMWIIFGLLIITLGIYLFVVIIKNEDYPIIFLPICLIVFGLFMTISGCYWYNTPVKARYYATIDDNISINEVTEKYDIIEVNGKLFTLEEK